MPHLHYLPTGDAEDWRGSTDLCLLVLLIVLPVTFWGMGLNAMLDEIRWRRGARRAQGLLVGWEATERNEKTVYMAEIEFTSSEGKIRRFLVPEVWPDMDDRRYAGSIPVLYQPGNSPQARLDTFTSRHLPIMLLALAALLTVISVWWYQSHPFLDSW